MNPSELPAHHERVRAAVFEDPVGAPTTAAEIARLNEAMRAGTEAALAKAPTAEIRVDRYSLPDALRCPASSARGEFHWTANFAKRTLGLPALQKVVRQKRTLKDAVAVSIEDAVERGGDLGEWLSQQTEPARAATHAAAASWVCRAEAAVPWSALRKLVFDVRTWYEPLGRHTPAVYCGRSEAEVWVEADGRRWTVLLGVEPRNDVVTRLDVLTRALRTKRVPRRHVLVAPTIGEVVVTDVSVQLLELALEESLGAAHTLAEVAADASPRTEPGAYCAWCRRQSSCTPGRAWLSRRSRRGGGIPLNSL